jgi:competence CoiA-like predicted nuclease
MAKLKECLIRVEQASAIRRVVTELGLKMPKGKLAFRCPKCKRPVRPHVGYGKKPAPHFEHLSKNLRCPLSQ